MDLLTDVAAEPRTLPAPSYNISLNLSSILAFLPSRLLARIIWKPGADAAPADLPASTLTQLDLEEWASTANAGGAPDAMMQIDMAAPVQPSFPSPWGFFTSGYMLGLFVMAVLLHRMQNVVIPSRVHSRRHRDRGHAHRPLLQPPRSTLSRLLTPLHLRYLYPSLLPLDLSRTSTRLALHLPSLYFLSKVLLLWLLLVLQTAELYPSSLAEKWHLEWVGAWCEEKEMSEICWSTFCAICGAFAVEGFVKGLDGIGGGFPLGANMNPNTSPFNLVGYAFLLHVYSSPITHIDKGDGLPSRPDKHVIITIIIPLLQLTIFHYLSVSKRLSTHRLLPTALTSLLSLLHFHMTLFSHLLFDPPSPSPTSVLASAMSPTPTPISPSPSSSASASTMYTRRAPQPYSMPLLNYIPNTFETALLLTILLTVCLNALVQLLVRGRVERVFSGLGIGGGGGYDDDTHTFHLPYDEDFGVLLLRVGAASLEATGLRGWGNEVAPIPAPLHPRSRRPARSLHQHANENENEYGVVRIGRTAVGGVSAGRKRRQGGLRNEVRTVDLGVGGAAAGRAGGGGGGWLRWAKELWVFLGAVWGVVRGLGRVVWGMVRAGQKRRRMGGEEGRGREGSVFVGDGEREDGGDREGEGEEEDVYGRFLRGEAISDDEGDLDGYDDEDHSEDDGDEESDIDTPDGDDHDHEAATLLTELVRGDTSSGELVLAHLLAASPPRAGGGPLTRRRWGRLVAGSGGGARRGVEAEEELSAWEDDDTDYGVEARGRDGERDREREDAARSCCVVCTIEAREVICWPCRCLSMCDNCREALAARSAPTKHRCPCCRQIVEGYSRIYIP